MKVRYFFIYFLMFFCLLGKAQSSTDSLPQAQESSFFKAAITTNSEGEKVFNPKRENIKIETVSSGCTPSVEQTGLLWKFILGFGGGLLALLTPCVFPMIPMTVGYFTKRSKTPAEGRKNAIIYGLSIIGIYTGVGLFITAVFGPHILHTISTSWITNLIFFIVLLFFSISFFGFFEIVLPSSIANKADAQVDKSKGYLGIFFMAMVLAVVSFSCTGPIIGTVLTLVATDPLGPAAVMLGFSTALALPFSLFAYFPGWLQNLPKSGGWMNSVKVVLGFLELALAFKFLSTADLTQHWGILKYEAFLGIWVLIFLGLALYFLQIIKFPHDTKTRSFTPLNISLGVGTLVLVGYFLMGFQKDVEHCSYKSPALLSGLAPAGHYTIFPICSGKQDCPIGLSCFRDYEAGLAEARAKKKMIMIDFTGYGCVNCRKMEEHVWILPEIYNIIKDDVVLISLYVDDRAPLEETLLAMDGSKLRTKGALWANFEETNFKQVSQPLYCLLSPDEQILTPPVGYTPDVNEYRAFFQCGFDQLKKVCPDCKTHK